MLKLKVQNLSSKIYLALSFFVYLAVLIAIQYHYIFDLWNPSWGDMVSVPLHPIPFKNIFLLWFEQFSGSFGMVNIPHFMLSQFTRIVSPHLLQIIYINFGSIYLFFAIFNILGRFNIQNIKIRITANLLFSLFYLFSNVNISNYAQGQFETSIVYVFAMLMAFYMYFLFRDKKLTDILNLLFLLLFSTWYNWLSVFYIGFFLLPEFIVLSFWGFFKKRISIKEYILALFILAFIFLLANLNIFYQLYFNLFSAVTSISDSSSITAGNIHSEIDYMYANSSVLNSVYGSGNRGDISYIYFDYQSRFLDINYSFYTIFAVANVIGVIFLFLISYKKRKEFSEIDILLYTYVIYFIAVVLFTYILSLQKGGFFLDHLPLLSIYRNPKKFILSEFMFILIIYILFFIKMTDKKKYLGGFLLLVMFSFIARFQFLVTGYLGKDLIYNTNKITSVDSFKTEFANESSYPKYFSELKDFMTKNNLTQTERIVVIPNNSQTLYESFLRYDFPLFHVPANADILSGGDVNASIIHDLYTGIVDTDDISNFLKIGNVRYIVIDRKSPYYLWNYSESVKVREFGSIWLWGRPESVNRRVSMQPNLKKVMESDDFYIYEFVNHKDKIFYVPDNPLQSTDVTSIAENKSDLYIKSSEKNPLITSRSAEIRDVKKISPTDYEFILDVRNIGEVPIFFSQKYNSAWELNIKDAENNGVVVDSHSVGNHFGNAWLVKFSEPGAYKITADLKIQKTNALLTWISISVLFVLTLARLFIDNLVLKKYVFRKFN